MSRDLTNIARGIELRVPSERVLGFGVSIGGAA